MTNYVLNSNEKAWIEAVWQKTEGKLAEVAVRSRNKLPYTAQNGVHDDKSISAPDWWTNGFWGGMMWLMYAETKKAVYKDTALRSQELLDGALKDFTLLHHDVGFMYHLTLGVHARVFGSDTSRNKNLYLAAALASRYNPDGGFISAWNGREVAYWSIIDCLMNLPLLYWASDECGNDRFKRMAMNHADMALRDHIREDGSINHIVEHNPDTGEAVRAYAGQGYKEGSCWTRGEAWAVYGMLISYVHTKERRYLAAAEKCADYFVHRAEEFGWKIPVDFDQPKDKAYYDSTAGLCAACGLLEIAKYTDKERAEKYVSAALKILHATDECFCDYDKSTDALVLYGTERYPNENEDGVHIPIIYGDFFYAEALLKLRGNDIFVW